MFAKTGGGGEGVIGGRSHDFSRSINLQLVLSKEVYFINLCTGLMGVNLSEK